MLARRPASGSLRHRPTANSGSPSAQHEPRPPFADILCAVDGSRGSTEAVRQAIALSSAEARLGFVAVSQERGAGLAAQAELSAQRGREALEEAAVFAKSAGRRPTTALLSGDSVSDALLAEAAEHEVLVIGCRGGSRLGGIMLGSTATQLAHRTESPLLVARRTAAAEDFPSSILLASDGSPGSWAAARVATSLSRLHHCELRLVYVPDGTHPERYREVRKQVTMIEKATGVSPALVDNPGHVAERIGATARAGQSSLIVVGRRGVAGINSLGSVSERVVHRAPCSVLVVPPRRDAS